MPRYTHGHADTVLRSHRTRTAENSAGYLLPSLRAGLEVLDVGSGPGTITVDLAARVAEHNRRITALEHDIAHLLAEHGNPLEGVIGGGPIVAAQLVAHAGDVRRFRDAAAFAAYRGLRAVVDREARGGARPHQ